MSKYKRKFMENHSYFITFVTHYRNPILIENIDLLRESFSVSKKKYRYSIDAIVILPDHIHMIIRPEIAEDYSKIIRAIKYHFSVNCDEKYYANIKQSISRTKRGLKPIWQKRFYEHTIRDEKDFLKCEKYIYENPIKHKYVEKIEDWEYSSYFYKMIR